MKLKIGDKVWVKVPINATIKEVNHYDGYTIVDDNEIEYRYFNDDEVKKINSKQVKNLNKVK